MDKSCSYMLCNIHLFTTKFEYLANNFNIIEKNTHTNTTSHCPTLMLLYHDLYEHAYIYAYIQTYKIILWRHLFLISWCFVSFSNINYTRNCIFFISLFHSAPLCQQNLSNIWLTCCWQFNSVWILHVFSQIWENKFGSNICPVQPSFIVANWLRV